jgi:hypothetical protein
MAQVAGSGIALITTVSTLPLCLEVKLIAQWRNRYWWGAGAASAVAHLSGSFSFPLPFFPNACIPFVQLTLRELLRAIVGNTGLGARPD